MAHMTFEIIMILVEPDPMTVLWAEGSAVALCRESEYASRDETQH